ncbi:hypothetical protein A0H81_14112 [Grifola frondosa]|uniref:Polysaccharide lyase 14 domain-containing protein n=1 Tax=Grifola frondosa TaxID=5627 RepID=A0A1C7LNW5_GRIFR|nr:hypothetical protein A0H81_14112 [Grifola frondosa]
MDMPDLIWSADDDGGVVAFWRFHSSLLTDPTDRTDDQNVFQDRIAVSHHPDIARIPLNDTALGVHKVSSGTTHPVATFPQGSINPGNKHAPAGGLGFYLHGPNGFAKHLKDHVPKEVLMSYDVMFEEGWDWRKGGKLPGIYGGVGDTAYRCTGGRQTDRCKCFDLRLMWRENGAGELYAYLPHIESNTARMIGVPPRSIQHADYGFSVGRGAWRFTPGKWSTIAQRVKMNDVGHANAEIEVCVDGVSVILVTGLILRTEEGPDSRVQGLHFQTFFGGNSTDWASPKDQKAWFANISGAILESPSAMRDEL